MSNKLFKSFIAVAMVLGSALGFVACNEIDDPTTAEPKVELSASTLNFSKFEESQSVDIKSNSEWTVEVEESADWVTVTPMSGSKNGKITIAVSENSTGKVRTTTVKVYAMHKTYGKYGNEKLTIQQSGTENETVDEVLLYGDDFDGAEATKTYGSGNSWPYIDQFPEFANQKGPAAENVTYSGKGVSVRANSTSDGEYSDYAGSGVNNIFFGSSAYFQVNDIAPLEGVNFKVTFGTEKYTSDGDSTFKNEEFRIYVSKDGNAWAEIKEYTFAGTEGGRWNVATADFTLNAAVEKLYIKFEAKVASVYRLDDLKLFTGNGGQVIDLDNIEAPQPVEAKKVTVAEFLAAAEDSTIYELTGEITSVTNTTYGNFYLNDGTAEVLIYGLCSPSGEQKYWAESGAKVGDTITVQTVRTSYNGTPQGKDAIFVSLVPGEGGSQTPEPAEGPYASDAAFVCSTDDSTNAAYSITGTSINGNAATGFKLGKSKQAGKFTSGVVSVSGNKYLNFYAQGWKGGDVTLYFRVNGGATMSQKLASHDGVTGNPPYTALSFAETDHYSVLLEGLTETSTIEFSTDANFELTTADSTMASARAIVCGVKLSDEPINPEDGGNTENPTPEPTPGEIMTIAEALAVGQGNTIGGVIEGVVVSNMDLNNLTSKKGLYVQDETGALQFYLGANHEFAFGTKVKIDLTTATLGSYNGAVQVSGVGLDKITVLSTGNTVEAKTVSMADFLANKYEGQYIALEGVQVAAADLAKTWVVGGAHTSINMTDVDGNKFVVFSSKYATYGAETVAQGAGTIKGIASINNGNMQIIFAQATDYAGLTGERFTEPETPENPEQPETPEQPAEVVKATVSEFLAAAEDATIYELTGVITSVTNTTYGNFYLKDDTAEVLIYGLCSPTGAEKYWAESGAKVGDTITVQTVRTSYNGTAQGKNAIFVSLVPCEAPEIDPNGKFASQDIFTANIVEENKVYLHDATINGEACKVIKFGTSSVVGTLTSSAVGVSGDATLSFYGVAWNGKAGKIAISVDGTEVETLTLTSNAGAAGNPPYTITLDETADCYNVSLTGLKETSTITLSSVSGATRIILAGVTLE